MLFSRILLIKINNYQGFNIDFDFLIHQYLAT